MERNGARYTPRAELDAPTGVDERLKPGASGSAGIILLEQPTRLQAVDTLLVVTHSDDEVIFASTVLLKNTGKVLVVCLTCGRAAVWKGTTSLHITPKDREDDFMAAVRASSNFPISWSFEDSWDGLTEYERQEAIRKLISLAEELQRSEITIRKVITHGSSGEYGHPAHKQTHQMVKDVLASSLPNSTLYTFSKGVKLSERQLHMKQRLWKFHGSQQHVLSGSESVRQWFYHEALCRQADDGCCIVDEVVAGEWDQQLESPTPARNTTRFYELLGKSMSPRIIHSAFKECFDCLPVEGEFGSKLAWMFTADRAWKFGDRQLLHNLYLPAFARRQFDRVLWVGVFPGSVSVQYYFQAYARNISFFTLEPNPAMTEWGAVGNHITDEVQNLKKYRHLIPEKSLELVMMHGVFGWGVNSRRDVRDAAEALHHVMKPGGVLYLWRNHESPGDADRDTQSEGTCGSEQFLHDLFPYFQSYSVNSSKKVPSMNIIKDGRVDLLHHRCS